MVWGVYIWREVEFLCPPWQGNGSFEKAFPHLLRQGVVRLPQTPYGLVYYRLLFDTEADGEFALSFHISPNGVATRAAGRNPAGVVGSRMLPTQGSTGLLCADPGKLCSADRAFWGLRLGRCR